MLTMITLVLVNIKQVIETDPLFWIHHAIIMIVQLNFGECSGIHIILYVIKMMKLYILSISYNILDQV